MKKIFELVIRWFKKLFYLSTTISNEVEVAEEKESFEKAMKEANKIDEQ